MQNEGKNIIKEGIAKLKLEVDKIPGWKVFISKMEEFANDWYESLSNEEKMLFVTLFDKINQGDYKGVLAYIEYFTPIIDQLPWVYVLFFGLWAAVLWALIAEWIVLVGSMLVVWWLLSSAFSATEFLTIDTRNKKVKFRNKYIDNGWDLIEDSIF